MEPEEHINTFENGMTSDAQVVLQPDGTYRYMKNCQLVSQDGNNYVIKDCLGNLKTFAVNIPYNAVYTVTGTPPMPIGFISFPNKLIVLSTNDESVDILGNPAGGYGEIGIINYLPYGEGVQPLSVTGQLNSGYTPLYHSKDLKFSKFQRVEGFSYIENELIERIYWTDNFNEPRVFNVSDPVFSTYIASGSLVVNNTYMVLQGAIEYPVGSGFRYGPGLTLGNIFTATIPNITYTNLTGTTPSPRVIDYYPVQLLNFTPARTLGNITFKDYGSGQLFCGSKVYFYRYGKSGIPMTTWSYGSSPVPVGTINNFLNSPSVPYHDFVGGGITTTLLNSTLSVFVTIENIDTTYDFIELACAEFDQLIDVPRQITIVNRVNISSFNGAIEHTGAINLGTLTLADITLFPASILKCKTLATDKNYILAGNTTERAEIIIDNTVATGGVTLSAIPYAMNSHREATSCSLSGMVYSGVSPSSGVNPAAGSVFPDSRWKVTVGQPIYNGVTYVVGDVITGVTGAGNDSIDFATHAGSQARPCVTKNRYTSIATGKRVENSIELFASGPNPENTCFADYKSAAAHHHVAGHWSGETYRYARILWDLKGNPFFAGFIGDFTFPTIIQRTNGTAGTDGILKKTQIGNVAGHFVYSVVPQLLNVSGFTIPADIIDQISGFSIVRAERDARIITQGLVTQNVDTGASPKVYRPGAYNPIVADLNGVADKVYTFICPDTLVDLPLKKPIGVIGDTMEEAIWLMPFDYGASDYARGAGGVVAPVQIYNKYLSCVQDGSTRTGIISYFDSVDESQTLSNLGAGVTYENGSMEINPAAGTNVIGTCVSGAANYSVDGRKMTGCKKSVFILNSDFTHYGPAAHNYTSNDASVTSLPEKILMNYVKTGFSNPYGGTGEQALANTIYISTGHFQPITNQVKQDTLDGNGNYTFNNIEIAGGDCFTCLIDIGYGIYDVAFPGNALSYAWTFPCECNSNYNLRRGRKTSNVEMFYDGTALTESIIIGSTIKLEDFSYNQGYSTEDQVVKYPALPVNFVNSNQFHARIRFAGQKFIGEIADSFRTFALLDFKDFSANYGKIVDIRVKEDKVIVWQDLAVNTTPVLERQLLGAATGDATTIGTGGVIDRWDVISSFFGSQHQWSITETEYGFAFFDMHRKAFVILDFSGGLLEISQVYGEKGFFDEAFIEVEGNVIITNGSNLLLNSPIFSGSADRPLMGVGITGVYDPKLKMTYMTFKFKGQKQITISASQVDATKSKDFTIGYLHTKLKKCFIGFYDWLPAIAHNHNQIVLSATNPKNRSQFLAVSGTNTGLSFAPPDTYSVGSDMYVCILAVTLDNVAKYPTGASGSTYWTKVCTTNELQVLNQPTALGQTIAPDYQYNKFDGVVVDNEIHVIVNPKTENPFSVLNIQQVGPYNVNYTDIYTDAVNQSAADNSIPGTSRFYRFIWNAICSSLPLSSTGRIVNNYLRIRFVKKNWTSDPTTVTASVKILQSLKSFFVQKR